MDDTYERTYSQSLGQAIDAALARPPAPAPSTTSDYAIACALAEIREASPPAPRPDTSMDEQLAKELHERDQRKLLRQPSRRARRRDRALRSLLHHLKPTRLIPRLNPVAAPTASYANADRSRLLLRLDMYGLQERQVDGDGNCQFRALADQLFFKQSRHAEVRQAVVDQLISFPERYQDYVLLDYPDYVRSMNQPGTWGDHVTLQAAADAFHVGINIITSFLDNCVISISPTVDDKQPPDPQQIKQELDQRKQAQEQQAQGVEEQAMHQMQQAPATQELQELQQPFSPVMEECITLWLSFWAEVHYNSLAPKPSADSSIGSASEDSSSEDEGSHRTVGKMLGKLFR